MLDIESFITDIPKHFFVPNMLLLAGSGQNVGKTSFAVDTISYLKSLGYIVYGLKITPHFHNLSPSHLIVQTDGYQVSLEKNRNSDKDSSRMLKAGANEVFFVQIKNDKALLEAFNFVYQLANEKVLWVCESGGLRSFVEPGLFLYFKLKGEEPQKNSAKILMPLADRIVEFNGAEFDIMPKQIDVKNFQFKFI